MLELLGALFLTGLLIWITLSNLAVFAYSDENVRNTIAWNWKFLWPYWALNLLILGLWIFLVAMNVHVSLS
jgi:hypothetical protein